MYNNTRVLISYKKVKDLDNIPGPHKGEVPEYWVFVTLWALGLGLLMLEILLLSHPKAISPIDFSIHALEILT